MQNNRLVFLDVETTGVNTAVDRVWQFSALCEHTEPLNLLMNPCIPVPPEVCSLVGKPELNNEKQWELERLARADAKAEREAKKKALAKPAKPNEKEKTP